MYTNLLHVACQFCRSIFSYTSGKKLAVYVRVKMAKCNSEIKQASWFFTIATKSLSERNHNCNSMGLYHKYRMNKRNGMLSPCETMTLCAIKVDSSFYWDGGSVLGAPGAESRSIGLVIVLSTNAEVEQKLGLFQGAESRSTGLVIGLSTNAELD
jgi:hypothetical protein